MNAEVSRILVTIVVPVYNVEKYLARCVDSLLAQTHTNIEIILVDDGSTDNCPSLCDDFAQSDERIVVLHKQNAGLGEARNSGIELAKGEWIGFVDSDDFVSERFVEYLLGAAVENGALLARCKSVKGRGEKLPIVSDKPRTKTHDITGLFIHCLATPGYSILACWTNLCHISVFEKIRFPALKYAEDIPAVQECFEYAGKQPLVTVDEAMYYYFQRSGSIMNSKANLALLDQSMAFDIALEFWEKKGNQIVCEIFRSVYFAYLIDAYARLRRDVPALREQYEHLAGKIKLYLPAAVREAHQSLVLPALRFGLFDYIQDKAVVMYGYGANGMKMMPWLQYFGVNICEVWDAAAPPAARVDNMLLVKMHQGLPSDTVILITVEDRFASLSIKRGLLELGYNNIIEWPLFEAEYRYRIYEAFLPFLLETA
jgi:glycosyltransferase involved in cell wall biosynthesis